MINTKQKYLPNENLSNPGAGEMFRNLRFRAEPAEQKQFQEHSLHRAGESAANQLLASLPDRDYARIAPHLKLLAFASGEELYSAGEYSRYVYFPKTLIVSHICDLTEGDTIQIAMVGGEGATGICSIYGLQPPLHRAEVVNKGTAWRISADALKQEFAAGGSLSARLLNYVNLYQMQISQRIICESFHSIEKRFCTWLATLDDKLKGNHLLLTHEQIALFLGASRPIISGIAKTLREDGLIDYVRGKFYILDKSRLEKRACECYAALNQVYLNATAAPILKKQNYR